MRVLSVRLRKPDMLEEPMPGKCYVSMSALSGIFCSVGDYVLPTPPRPLNATRSVMICHAAILGTGSNFFPTIETMKVLAILSLDALVMLVVGEGD
jgi:hypothetical protein